MTTRATPRCPICGLAAAPPRGDARAPAPFCSTRCADIDLGRWFTGQYRIAAEPDAEPGAAPDGGDPGPDG